MSRYLLETDLFARSGTLVPLAGFPAYPTGPSFVPYMASRIIDSFLEFATPLFHNMELISIGLAAMDLIRIGTKLGSTNNSG